MWNWDIPEGSTPLGYKKLLDLFGIKTLPHYRWSYVSPSWTRKELHFQDQNISIYIYPSTYKLSENVFDHLEFALKHEGLNLYIIKAILKKIDSSQMLDYLSSKPLGKYKRLLWFFYESFKGEVLLIPDLKQSNYISLLDPEQYYCSKPIKSPRHYVLNNLLGSLEFSPIVRKTALLQGFEKKNLRDLCLNLTKQYDPYIFIRAMRYLYTKETLSSWEIESEKPDNARLSRFVTFLHKADSIGKLTERVLVELQKQIVEPRFALDAYRTFQNYVGEELGLDQMIVHYIAPRSNDVSQLMANLINCFEKMEQANIDPVIAAAILSFSFVFIHPFEDGNGRIHRFLIHYALAHLKLTPEGVVFPISAVIARNLREYDKTLEFFSKPLMELITQYKINDIGEMTVSQDTIDFYKYIDFTPIVEYLYNCVIQTITIDFQQELAFLNNYDIIKQQCKEIVDMPDQRLDLFIKCVRQNNGTLSSRKRQSLYHMLTDEEIAQMEAIINQHKSVI